MAVGLSFVLPGAGHAYIRDWIRAVLFAALFLTMISVILPLQDLSAVSSFSEGVSVVNAETSQTDQFVISFIMLFAAIDAGFRAFGYPAAKATPSDSTNCPHCGRELDEDLEFCHWCTRRLDRSSIESES